jgi:hypothetical protein
MTHVNDSGSAIRWLGATAGTPGDRTRKLCDCDARKLSGRALLQLIDELRCVHENILHECPLCAHG